MSEASGDVQVTKDEVRSRYEAHIDGELAGWSEYDVRGGAVVFPHTVTLPAFGGQGVASEVARVSLDDAREQGLRVVPVCSFYVDYLRRHPEYQDLLGR